MFWREIEGTALIPGAYKYQRATIKQRSQTGSLASSVTRFSGLGSLLMTIPQARKTRTNYPDFKLLVCWNFQNT